MNQGNRLQDCADDWMSRDLQILEPGSTVQQAAKLMADKEVGSILVKKKDKNTVFGTITGTLEGIVTDTDIVRKVIAQNLDPSKIRIEKIMSHPIKTIPINFPMIEICRIVSEHKIKRLPVTKNGKLKGIMSITDLMYAMVKMGKFYDLGKFVDDFSDKRVKDDKAEDVLKASNWMSHPVITISKETTMLSAAQIMDKHKLGALPVLAGPGYVVGIITDTDIVRKIAAQNLDSSKTLVQDIMTKQLVMGHPDQTLIELGQILVNKRLKRIPIIDSQDFLVGIISTTDIISILLQMNNISHAQKLIKMLYKGTADYFG